MEKFSFQNIIDGQALGISVTGMSIVFAGLLLISIYITILPRILDFLDQSRSKKELEHVEVEPEESTQPEIEEQARIEPVDNETNDIASVIGLVLQLEQERVTSTENEQITISSNIGEPSPWSRVGRMRKMPQRRTHAKI